MKVYVGIDVHTTNYTLATAITFDKPPVYVNSYSPKVSNIVAYCKDLKNQFGRDTEVITGYEAGTLGFSLRRDLEKHGITCIVMAPSTIFGTELNRKRRKKTDKRDAAAIARALLTHGYSEVHMPDEEDEAVRDYIRMREDIKFEQKRVKQQISALCHRHGFQYKVWRYELFDGYSISMSLTNLTARLCRHPRNVVVNF